MEMLLDAAGTADPTGAIDVIHAGKLLTEGRVVDAALTGIGVVPIAGDAAKLLKYAKHARKMPGADHVADAVDDVVHAGAKSLLRKGGVDGWRKDKAAKTAAATGPKATGPAFGMAPH